MSLYAPALLNIHLDRFLLFINPRDINDAENDTLYRKATHILLSRCADEDNEHLPICQPDVQYFGWKVTAIILIIVTVGSLILVISLSVTMPYNVWDKPKIQRLHIRRTDGFIAANQ